MNCLMTEGIKKEVFSLYMRLQKVVIQNIMIWL